LRAVLRHSVHRAFLSGVPLARRRDNAAPSVSRGNNSYATGVNDRGQAVGWAENGIHDTTCTFPQVLQFRAAIWGPGENQMQELHPILDDSSSAATAINNKGQVVGISGRCDRAFGRFSAFHAVLWENGAPTDLGNFGGVAWNTPTAINSHGQVAGFSDFPGDQAGGLNSHAFLWSKQNGLEDLKTLPGDAISLAFGINDRGQVVGQSIGANGSHAFLWEDGVMKDLNDLVPSGHPFSSSPTTSMTAVRSSEARSMPPATASRSWRCRPGKTRGQLTRRIERTAAPKVSEALPKRLPARAEAGARSAMSARPISFADVRTEIAKPQSGPKS
jgi:probable HAF family extracellular repeat protein